MRKILFAMSFAGLLAGCIGAYLFGITQPPLPPAFSPPTNPFPAGIYAEGIVESDQPSGENINIYPATGGNPNASAMPSFGGTAPGGNNGAQPQENLSPEAQVLMIEKNRLDTQELVDKGLMPPLPPTPLTPADATAAGGSSLIANPDTPKQ